MQKKIDEHLVKISAGFVPIADELAIDEDVTLIVQGAVTKTEDRSNQNGTVKRVYTVKGIIAEAVKEGQSIGKKQGRQADEVQQEAASKDQGILQRMSGK